MACCLRSWNFLNSFTQQSYCACSKLTRVLCTESHIAATEDARDPALQKNEPDLPKIQQARIKNELSFHLPTVSLPPKLADSLKEVLKHYSKKEALAAGESLIDHLKSREKMTKTKEWSDSLLRYGGREALATMVTRINATYAATLRVLNEIQRRRPRFKPETVLDFGSGLGTAIWAVDEIWKKSVYEYLSVDTSEEMENLAKKLRRGGTKTGKELIKNVYYKQYMPMSSEQSYDLVIAAYSLGEMTPSLLRSTVHSLWRNTSRFLVLIEIGDKVGFQCITNARNHLIKVLQEEDEDVVDDDYLDEKHDRYSRGGYIFAPCMHELECPYVRKQKGYCHFGQRSTLSLYQERQPRFKQAGCFTENYSYLVLCRGDRPGHEKTYARLLKPAKMAKRIVVCNICPPNGYAEQRIYTKKRSGKDVYRMVRHHTEWGDLVPLIEAKPEAAEDTTDPPLKFNDTSEGELLANSESSGDNNGSIDK